MCVYMCVCVWWTCLCLLHYVYVYMDVIQWVLCEHVYVDAICCCVMFEWVSGSDCKRVWLSVCMSNSGWVELWFVVVQPTQKLKSPQVYGSHYLLKKIRDTDKKKLWLKGIKYKKGICRQQHTHVCVCVWCWCDSSMYTCICICVDEIIACAGVCVSMLYVFTYICMSVLKWY